VRRQRTVEVRPHEGGQRRDRGARLVEQWLQRRGNRAVAVRVLDLAADDGRRCGGERLELLVDARERTARGRADEVGRVAVLREQRQQRRQVEAGGALARLADPGEVQGLRVGVAQRAQALHRLHQRRDGEAHRLERPGTESQADHLS
jgi:hypothetical protein